MSWGSRRSVLVMESRIHLGVCAWAWASQPDGLVATSQLVAQCLRPRMEITDDALAIAAGLRVPVNETSSFTRNPPVHKHNRATKMSAPPKTGVRCAVPSNPLDPDRPAARATG
ncbi:hypothetical protein F5B19DRAFT_498579 [Rostrohypoxylon terebratum]|nr:hypothetical protein F5B19DRAFT_498579 [Rostrohypoxylon terebratum]